MSIDLPNYQILEKLGTGANSVLFLGRNMQTGARYTIKVVKVSQPEDMKFVEQLKDEHACGSTVDYPVIRKTFELRYIRRRLTKIKSAVLFMEYVEGTPLNDSEASWSLTDLLRYFIEVAEGLNAMHRAGFVHADLKPGNILITPDRRVKLIDFGQACKISTAKQRIQGTVDYMAPEQAARGVLDARTDVFGLGATLYKILTGQPIATDMNQNVSMQCLRLVGKRVSDLNQPVQVELAGPIERLIQTSCEKDPGRRPANMKEMKDRLEMCLTTLERREAAERQNGGEADPGSPAGSGVLAARKSGETSPHDPGL